VRCRTCASVSAHKSKKSFLGRKKQKETRAVSAERWGARGPVQDWEVLVLHVALNIALDFTVRRRQSPPPQFQPNRRDHRERFRSIRLHRAKVSLCARYVSAEVMSWSVGGGRGSRKGCSREQGRGSTQTSGTPARDSGRVGILPSSQYYRTIAGIPRNWKFGSFGGTSDRTNFDLFNFFWVHNIETIPAVIGSLAVGIIA
jgi:hypothetical protein